MGEHLVTDEDLSLLRPEQQQALADADHYQSQPYLSHAADLRELAATKAALAQAQEELAMLHDARERVRQGNTWTKLEDAREAAATLNGWLDQVFKERDEAQAALAAEQARIRAEERERCAQIAERDSLLSWVGGSTGSAKNTALNIAAAIREEK